MEEYHEVPLILGRPFLATGRVMIDVQQDNLILKINDEHVTFNVFKSMKYSSSLDTCFKIDAIDQFVDEKFQEYSLRIRWRDVLLNLRTSLWKTMYLRNK